MANWQWDEILLACDLVAQNSWKELRPHHSEVIELSKFLRSQAPSNTLISDPEFRNPNGVSRKTTDIMTAHPDYRGAKSKGGRTTTAVVLAYIGEPAGSRQLAADLRSDPQPGIDAPPLGAPIEDNRPAVEGHLIRRLTSIRERDPKLRKRKLDEAMAARGNLACEICTFDFARTYGDLGDGYVHVHHVTPLHVSGMVRTELDQLILVCANCHVMLHHGLWRTPDQLRALLQGT